MPGNTIAQRAGAGHRQPSGAVGPGAAEMLEVAMTQSLTTTVVSYLRWILDRAAMMFQIPAEPSAAGRWTGR